MVGGCDLDHRRAVPRRRHRAPSSPTPGRTGAFIYVGHTETLRQSALGDLPTASGTVVDRMPFLDQGVFASPVVVDPDYDVLVLQRPDRLHPGPLPPPGTGLVVPWHQFDCDATDPASWPWLERRFAREGVDRAFLEWFAEEFEFLGGDLGRPVPGEHSLAGRHPCRRRARLILLNGAEVPVDNPKEPDRHLHHRTMNAALDEVVADLPNASVCDVRVLRRAAEDDLMSDIRHYRRHVYLADGRGDPVHRRLGSHASTPHAREAHPRVDLAIRRTPQGAGAANLEASQRPTGRARLIEPGVRRAERA